MAERSTAAGWKGKQATEGTDLTLPSENVALVRPIRPEAFLQSGMIPDPLTGIIQKSINTKKGLPPSKVAQISEDPKLLASTMIMLDRVVAYAVLEPQTQMPPTCIHKVGEEVCGAYAAGEGNEVHTDTKDPNYHSYQEGPREDDVLYTDQVTLDDKLFIFNWCAGGTRDVESFREELQGTMESVSGRSNVQQPAKRASRSR